MTSMLAGFGRASSEGEATILPLIVHEAGFEVLFLHHGRLVAHAPTPEFFSHPKSKETAAFLEGRLLW